MGQTHSEMETLSMDKMDILMHSIPHVGVQDVEQDLRRRTREHVRAEAKLFSRKQMLPYFCSFISVPSRRGRRDASVFCKLSVMHLDTFSVGNKNAREKTEVSESLPGRKTVKCLVTVGGESCQRSGFEARRRRRRCYYWLMRWAALVWPRQF